MIVEILNDDGTMARRPDLEVFAEKHGLKLGTIADLIEYRNHTETTIERVAQCKLPTEYGEFELVTYRDIIDKQIHFALRKGDITSAPTLVRVHLQDTYQSAAQQPCGRAQLATCDSNAAYWARRRGVGDPGS